MRTKIDSPYTASVTGGGFLFTETGILLPLLQSEDSAMLLKDEAVNNNLLQINVTDGITVGHYNVFLVTACDKVYRAHESLES